MPYATPNYTKSQVRRAGDALVEGIQLSDPTIDPMEVLSNWREVHAYPMQTTLMLLRTHAYSVDAQSVVSQRLKRAISIQQKLRRYPSMKLDRMQDIAGCRAIVASVSEVRALHLRLKASRTKHILHSESDYITRPKTSGYRGIHLVFRYSGAKTPYVGLSVEVQLRSRLQHAWATSVEIVDTFTDQSLKASRGSAVWLRFFQLASAVIADQEACPLGDGLSLPDALEELREVDHQLQALKQLSAFTVSTSHMQKGIEEGFTYFLLRLDLRRRLLNVKKFKRSDLQLASEEYASLEKTHTGDPNLNIVLVSANSVKSVKAAYPNYFADSDAFLKATRFALQPQTLSGLTK